MPDFRRQGWLSWASIGLMALLCAILAVLQYRWIGEIAGAERGRLQEELRSRLQNIRGAFNDELSRSIAGLMPGPGAVDEKGREAAYTEQYLRWRESHDRIFRHLGIAIPTSDGVRLTVLDPDTGRFASAEWPPEWSRLRA